MSDWNLRVCDTLSMHKAVIVSYSQLRVRNPSLANASFGPPGQSIEVEDFLGD